MEEFKIKNRAMLLKTNPGVLYWLKRNKPELLEKYLPCISKYKKEECIKSAKKYKTRGEWYEKDRGFYGAARRNGWLDECCKHMKAKIKHTKEECIKIAKKYETRSEWHKENSGYYNVARRNGWLDECCKHMKAVQKRRTKKECIKIAKKYETRSEWFKKDNSSYETARRNGWLDECCKHMKNKYAGIRKKVINLDTQITYHSLTEAANENNLAGGSSISRAIENGTKARGYRWAYVD